MKLRGIEQSNVGGSDWSCQDQLAKWLFLQEMRKGGDLFHVKKQIAKPKLLFFGAFIWYILVKTELYVFCLARNNFILPLYFLWELEIGPDLRISLRKCQAMDMYSASPYLCNGKPKECFRSHFLHLSRGTTGVSEVLILLTACGTWVEHIYCRKKVLNSLLLWSSLFVFALADLSGNKHITTLLQNDICLLSVF